MSTTPRSCTNRRLASTSFFFFQAEDGIRDIGVTGVQTCALPISRERQGETAERLRQFLMCLERNDVAGVEALLARDARAVSDGGGEFFAARQPIRSEERRVGKECRSRWSPYH